MTNRRGFTLVELLAAIGVASIALTMLASAVRSQGSSAMYQMGTADMQQNVRGALEVFRREVRMAGYGMSSVRSAVLPIVNTPAPGANEIFRVVLFGNFNFVRSRVVDAGVAAGGGTVLLTPSGPAGACLPGLPAKQFTQDQRVSIESALRGVADVYTVTGYSAVNCSITVTPNLVAPYDGGSSVNEIQQVAYSLGTNNVLSRNDVIIADQIDLMEMTFILEDGTEVVNPSAVLPQLRSAGITLRSEKPERDGLTPRAELQSEVRIRNLDLVREPMVDNL